jgi:hypothetical protein
MYMYACLDKCIVFQIEAIVKISEYNIGVGSCTFLFCTLIILSNLDLDQCSTNYLALDIYIFL